MVSYATGIYLKTLFTHPCGMLMNHPLPFHVNMCYTLVYEIDNLDDTLQTNVAIWPF